ncbi:MAG TPA: hypothetical protein VGS60_05580 [Actinomycetes bacterium]|jgi:hypothetical protein|nr:hypothetical protein [Actinomycetes bacterium]
MTADGLTLALEDYQRVQDDLVEARNRLAYAITGAAMSGLTRPDSRSALKDHSTGSQLKHLGSAVGVVGKP